MSFIATIESLTRLTNTRYGNPRYRVHLRGGAVLLTRNNSEIAGLIRNREYLHRPVLVKVDENNRIWDVVPQPMDKISHLEWHDRTFTEMGSRFCLQCRGRMLVS